MIDGVEIVSQNDSGFYVLYIILFILALMIYFLPSFIAFKRHHASRYGILIINLFFGWTFLGWVISLAWSVSKKD